MENTIYTYDKKAYRTTILQGGLLLGLLLSLPNYICWAANIYDQSLGGYATFLQFSIYFIVMIVMGKKAYRIFSPDGSKRFTYGQAYAHSIIMALWSGVVVGVLTWLLFSVIAPDYYVAAIDYSLAQVVATTPDITDEMIEMSREMSISVLKPYIMIPVSMFSSAFMGALIALISSLIVKKEIKKS